MMHDPLAALSIYAEVSIALLGFSGIVIAFGHRSRGTLSRLESRRLANLFACSSLVLVMSLIGIALVHHTAIEPSFWWRSGSASLFVIGLSWVIYDAWRVRQLTAEERTGVNRFILYSFNFVAVVGLALLLVNTLAMAEPWPLFLAFGFIITFALQQFILLVRMGYDSE